MRIVLGLLLICGISFSGDLPYIPHPNDINGWDQALKPKEERFDPFMINLEPTKTLTGDVTVTWISSGKFAFTLFETSIGGILLQGKIRVQVLHVFKENGYKIIVTNIGTFFEMQTKLFWIR